MDTERKAEKQKRSSDLATHPPETKPHETRYRVCLCPNPKHHFLQQKRLLISEDFIWALLFFRMRTKVINESRWL